MAENYDQGQEVIVGNRRMRKIKRPKQHADPRSFVQNAPTPEYAQSQQPQQPQSNVNQAPANNLIANYVEPNNNQNTQHLNAPIVQEEYVYENEPYQEEYVAHYDMVEKKKVLMIAVACLFVGLLVGKFVFSSSEVVQNGLQGVVVNPEVPKGRSRCGMVEKTQGCVLYVMNPQRQDMNGRDFYDLAAQQTGRQRFVIETGNMRYSSVRIRPGAIAQLNIPPLQ